MAKYHGPIRALALPTGNKYHVAKVADRTYRGTVYHSKREAMHAALLDTLKGATDPQERVLSWERQVRLPLRVKGKLLCHYVVDFVVHYANGRESFQEVKGFITPESRLKMKLFAILYPEHPLDMIR